MIVRKLTTFGLACALIYFLLLGVYFISAPFMVGWGAELPWDLNIIAIVRNIPFGLIDPHQQVNAMAMFVNPLIHAIILGALYWIAFHYIRGTPKIN